MERVEEHGDFNPVVFQVYLDHIRLMCTLSAMRGHNIYKSRGRAAEAVWRIPIGDLQETKDMNVIRARSSFAEEYRLYKENLRRWQEDALLTTQELPALQERGDRLRGGRLIEGLQRYIGKAYKMFDKCPYLSKRAM
jgi:hypothetical protein